MSSWGCPQQKDPLFVIDMSNPNNFTEAEYQLFSSVIKFSCNECLRPQLYPPRTSHMQNIKLFSEVQIALFPGVEEGQEEECLMSRYTTYKHGLHLSGE